jgi:hypothetical protein
MIGLKRKIKNPESSTAGSAQELEEVIEAARTDRPRMITAIDRIAITRFPEGITIPGIRGEVITGIELSKVRPEGVYEDYASYALAREGDDPETTQAFRILRENRTQIGSVSHDVGATTLANAVRVADFSPELVRLGQNLGQFPEAS